MALAAAPTGHNYFTHCPDEEGTEIDILRSACHHQYNFTHCPDEEGTEIVAALRSRLLYSPLHSLPR